ncbi:ATP-binding protein [Streptomyces netropsis]|nr:ATP-binding protein [Streptomyces netropsis]
MYPSPLAQSPRRPSVGPPSHTTFPSAPESVGAARGYALEIIERDAPGIAPAHVADVQLVVSELVTNSFRYGTEPGDRVALTISASANRVRVEVHDPTRRRPRFKPESEERQRGRGMFIVEHLAEIWGVDDRPLGKTVWAELTWH